MADLHGLRSAGAGQGGLKGGLDDTPMAWRTPYELYDERRKVSSSPPTSSQSNNDVLASSHTLSSTTTSSSSNAGSTASAASSAIADCINVRGISIAGWRIETHRGSIADSKTIDDLSDTWGIPLPEMPFDKNRLVLRFENGSSSSSSSSEQRDGMWEYAFDGMSALRSVEGVLEQSALHGIDFGAAQHGSGSIRNRAIPGANLGQKPQRQRKRVQVSYANEWGKKRDQQQQQQQQPAPVEDGSASTQSNFGPDVAMAAANGTIATARDFDWTYSCTWPGAPVQSNLTSSSNAFEAAKDPAQDRIPIEKLGPPSTPNAKAEPILFFDDLILFEDELGDNGTSLLNVKIRVMPTGFLVLQRFFLRVDNVVFRVFDTRMYVGFYDDHNEAEANSTRRQPPASSTMPTPTGIPQRGVLPPMTAHAPSSDFARLSLGAPRKAMAGASTHSVPQPARPPRVIRECCGYQESYAAIRARLPAYKPNDLSPLTDPGWVAQQVTKLSEDRKQSAAAMNVQRRRQEGPDALHAGTMVSMQQGDPTYPAVLPSTHVVGQESNRILGEITDTSEKKGGEERWEGEGHRIDVALLQ